MDWLDTLDPHWFWLALGLVLAIGEMLRQVFADLPGTVECGELGVREEARGLVLPTAIWARWSND